MRPLALLVLLVLAGATGCGKEASPGSSPGGDELGGEYVVTAVTEGGGPRDLVPGSEIRLRFADGMLGARAGCNHLSASYELEGDTLIAGRMGGTEMGCPEPLMQQDAWLVGLFEEPVAVGHDPLTLTSGEVVLTLTPREEAAPDRPLAGTRWVLDGIVDGDAVGSVPAGPEVVLTLAGTAAQVSGLCNGWGAEIAVASSEITWTPGMRTLMACADDARNELDTTVASLLTGRTAYEIEERTLRVTNGDRGLVFVAAE
jgi:heat shock protein HslJ